LLSFPRINAKGGSTEPKVATDFNGNKKDNCDGPPGREKVEMHTGFGKPGGHCPALGKGNGMGGLDSRRQRKTGTNRKKKAMLGKAFYLRSAWGKQASPDQGKG